MPRIHASPGAMVYARALFEAADAAGGVALLTEIGQRLDTAGEAWHTDRVWRAYFLSGSIPESTKADAMKRIVESDERPPLLGSMMKLLLERGRLFLLDQIAVGFRGLLDERLGRIPVTLTTAVPIAEIDFRTWTDQIRQAIGGEPVVEHVVDPQIIAGAIIRVGDRVIDGSARRRLNAFRQNIVQRGKQTHALQS
jgi:F-type H+-transporting ATPase subunit delta